MMSLPAVGLLQGKLSDAARTRKISAAGRRCNFWAIIVFLLRGLVICGVAWRFQALFG